jgi:alpha-D-ribose 1-methylphosphonate 5-triphosphate synthase subunit PhnH
MSAASIRVAFADPVREAQATFRATMDAMARPGQVLGCRSGVHPPAPLMPAATALILTLADYETSIWLDAPLRESADVAAFLRFHTGARLVEDPATASFALIADPRDLPPLSAFGQGEPAYPDRSTTLILQMQVLGGERWRLAGPGIDGETLFGATPLPVDFVAQLADNRARFPLGVDLIFTAADQIAALPRSTRIMGAA